MGARASLVLVCNSHLDPVWLWPWEEGVAATLSTFRAAAELCAEFDGFVFCHNEALLYRWVEDHEPALFDRIRQLVRNGRWHIMGGWYLQPDCNLPCGESFVRQILAGHAYFSATFGVTPRVAVNLDPFGHTRGLVQILAKAGYTGYLFCRPDGQHLSLPVDDFVWVGYDGSEVLAHRSSEHYNSERGKACAKVEAWLAGHAKQPHGLLLWGVGNHGGGPSREDLTALRALMRDTPGRAITHGTPEDYFRTLAATSGSLPRLARDLNPWAPGCYTTMSTVKRAHRRLEARLWSTEKMLAGAAVQDLLHYPSASLREAVESLLFCQFHDILPGSSVAEVEQQALQRLGHGLDVVERLRARAFFALLSGQPAAAEGEYPLCVCNPHPFTITETITCEFQPPEPNLDRRVFWQPELAAPDGSPVPLQVEKESCNIQVDQRKRITFRATLGPGGMTRYACRLASVPRPADPGIRPVNGDLNHRGEHCQVVINGATGLMTRYVIDGVEYLSAGAFTALVVKDSADPWGMKVRGFRHVMGRFKLLPAADVAALAQLKAEVLPPVRVIEDGPVRTVVEAVFAFSRSTLVIRYLLPKRGTEVGIEVRVHWSEPDAMLKLALPTTLGGMQVLSQVAYGVERQERPEEELVGQQWIACVSGEGSHALTLINDATYGFDYSGAELRVSCLRSPAHAGHPVDDVTPIVRQDRVEPRIDQGEHLFRFWMNAGPAGARLAAIDREATIKHEPPMALVVFPSGDGPSTVPGVTLSDDAIQMPAMKLSEDGRALIVRLFEPTGAARSTVVGVPAIGAKAQVELGPFELRTLRVDLESGAVTDVDLLEHRVER
jgi:alpha-mannosidase